MHLIAETVRCDRISWTSNTLSGVALEIMWVRRSAQDAVFEAGTNLPGLMKLFARML